MIGTHDVNKLGTVGSDTWIARAETRVDRAGCAARRVRCARAAVLPCGVEASDPARACTYSFGCT